MEPLDLPLVVKVQPSVLVNFSTSCLSAAVVVGTPAEVAVGGPLVASAAAEAAAVTVEGTAEAVVLVAATLGDSADD